MPVRGSQSKSANDRRSRPSTSRASTSAAIDPNTPSASEADPDDEDEDEDDDDFDQRRLPRRSDANLTREEKIQHHKKYQEIVTKVREAGQEGNFQDTLQTLKQGLRTGNDLYVTGDTGDTDFVAKDAQLMSHLSKGAVDLSKKLQTGSDKFKTSVFLEKLLTLINEESRLHRRSRGESYITADDWIEFGKKHGHIIKSAPKFEYLYGTFEPEPIELAQRKVGHRSRINYNNLKQTQAEKVDPNENKHDDTTNKHVQEMYRQLRKLSEKNQTERLPFFECLVDPRSFSQTVENLFHSSFLLKEGLIRIEPDDDNEPEVVPVTDPRQIGFSPSKRRAEPAKQSVLSFSMRDYQKWIEEYGISRPLLKPRKDKEQDKNRTQ